MEQLLAQRPCRARRSRWRSFLKAPLREWLLKQKLSRGFWIFFTVAFFFDFGFAVYFFLFNLYLLDFHFNERVIGLVGER